MRPLRDLALVTVCGAALSLGACDAPARFGGGSFGSVPPSGGSGALYNAPGPGASLGNPSVGGSSLGAPVQVSPQAQNIGVANLPPIDPNAPPLDPNAKPVQPKPKPVASAPADAGAAPATRTGVTGAWTAVSAGSRCRVQLSTSPSLDRYKASSAGCDGEMRGVTAWDFRDGEVVLFKPGDQVAARLRGANAKTFNGTTSAGAAVSLAR